MDFHSVPDDGQVGDRGDDDGKATPDESLRNRVPTPPGACPDDERHRGEPHPPPWTDGHRAGRKGAAEHTGVDADLPHERHKAEGDGVGQVRRAESLELDGSTHETQSEQPEYAAGHRCPQRNPTPAPVSHVDVLDASPAQQEETNSKGHQARQDGPHGTPQGCLSPRGGQLHRQGSADDGTDNERAAQGRNEKRKSVPIGVADDAEYVGQGARVQRRPGGMIRGLVRVRGG